MLNLIGCVSSDENSNIINVILGSSITFFASIAVIIASLVILIGNTVRFIVRRKGIKNRKTFRRTNDIAVVCLVVALFIFWMGGWQFSCV
jgi:succinate dehydrogenase/fumarate reductase cytochrome b subunit